MKSDQEDSGTSRKWKLIGIGGVCDLCGGAENVHRYKHDDTGEIRAVCNPCEQAG